MKRIAFVFALIFAFSFTMMAQVDEEEGQFFGGQRAIGGTEAYAQYDFGTITTNVVSHEFIIRNVTPNPMEIDRIDIPNGVSVTVVNKTIKPHEAGKIIVTIDKKYFNQTGQFALPIIVRTKQKMGQGLYVYKEAVYMVKGQVK